MENKEQNPINPSNAAIVLVDHQPGVLKMVGSLPAKTVTTHAALLAKLGEDLGIELVITSTRETLEFLGTNLPEIQKAAPKAYASRVKRERTLNALQTKHLLKQLKTPTAPIL